MSNTYMLTGVLKNRTVVTTLKAARPVDAYMRFQNQGGYKSDVSIIKVDNAPEVIEFEAPADEEN